VGSDNERPSGLGDEVLSRVGVNGGTEQEEGVSRCGKKEGKKDREEREKSTHPVDNSFVAR
jgi:hypothetical protein